MARPRAHSAADGLKTPHSVSLKVLRLTRPSLVQQFPLPHDDNPLADGTRVPWASSLAYPRAGPAATGFVLAPLLALPESFQSAHVGELFACTLCANVELPPGGDDGDGDAAKRGGGGKAVSGLRIGAEIASPSTPAGIQLELEDGRDGAPPAPEGGVYAPGASVQKVLRLNLQEEGDHTLAVTVAYTETSVGDGGRASGGRVRTFRKLYQFAAASLLSVRTKAGEVDAGRYVLEAQLENLGESGVVLETVRMNPKPPFRATSLNWDMLGLPPTRPPVLEARDVVQVAFLLEEERDKGEPELRRAAPGGEAKFVLGQLNIQWRSGMGDRGSINTGWLTGKRR